MVAIDDRKTNVVGAAATIHFLQGQHEKAYRWADRSLLEMPTSMQGLSAMAMSAAALGKAEQARVAASKLAALYPKYRDRIREMTRRSEDVDCIIQALRTTGHPD